jgi:hypothetical protein
MYISQNSISIMCKIKQKGGSSSGFFIDTLCSLHNDLSQREAHATPPRQSLLALCSSSVLEISILKSPSVAYLGTSMVASPCKTTRRNFSVNFKKNYNIIKLEFKTKNYETFLVLNLKCLTLYNIVWQAVSGRQFLENCLPAESWSISPALATMDAWGHHGVLYLLDSSLSEDRSLCVTMTSCMTSSTCCLN